MVLMVQQLLADWRDAERRLAEADDPAVIAALRIEVDRLRDEYRAAFDAAARAARSSGGSEPSVGA